MTGYLIGEFIWAAIFSISNHYSLASYIIITSFFTILVGLIGFLRRKSFVTLTVMVSIAAGFLFTRGLSLTIGGFPADAATLTYIVNDIKPDIGKVIWGYFFGALALTMIFLCWLSSYTMSHCDDKVRRYIDEAEKNRDNHYVSA